MVEIDLLAFDGEEMLLLLNVFQESLILPGYFGMGPLVLLLNVPVLVPERCQIISDFPLGVPDALLTPHEFERQTGQSIPSIKHPAHCTQTTHYSY